jgi:hypothetical protein
MATNTTAVSIITLASLVGFQAYAYQHEYEELYEEDIHRYPGIQPES